MKTRTFGLIIFFVGVAVMLVSPINGFRTMAGMKEFGVTTYYESLSTFERFLLTFMGMGLTVGGVVTCVGAALYGGFRGSRAAVFLVGAALTMLLLFFFDKVFGIEESGLFFGLGGTAIMLLFAAATYLWARHRFRLRGAGRTAADLQLAGYFFFFMAAAYT